MKILLCAFSFTCAMAISFGLGLAWGLTKEPALIVPTVALMVISVIVGVRLGVLWDDSDHDNG